MAAKALKLSRRSVVALGPSYRRLVKRDTARLARRLFKRLLANAPVRVTYGWAD